MSKAKNIATELDKSNNISVTKVFRNKINVRVDNVPDSDMSDITLGEYLIVCGTNRTELWYINPNDEDKNFIGYIKEEELLGIIVASAKNKIDSEAEKSVNYDLGAYLVNKLKENGDKVVNKSASKYGSTYYLERNQDVYTVTCSYKDEKVTVTALKRHNTKPLNATDCMELNIGNPDIDTLIVTVVDSMMGKNFDPGVQHVND
jgi:hypothetical protein